MKLSHRALAALLAAGLALSFDGCTNAAEQSLKAAGTINVNAARLLDLAISVEAEREVALFRTRLDLECSPGLSQSAYAACLDTLKNEVRAESEPIRARLRQGVAAQWAFDDLVTAANACEAAISAGGDVACLVSATAALAKGLPDMTKLVAAYSDAAPKSAPAASSAAPSSSN
jgi:hypothetical protein